MCHAPCHSLSRTKLVPDWKFNRSAKRGVRNSSASPPAAMTISPANTHSGHLRPLRHAPPMRTIASPAGSPNSSAPLLNVATHAISITAAASA